MAAEPAADRVARWRRDLGALAAVVGPPRVDATEVGLRRALMTGGCAHADVERLALAARYGEVAVLAAETVPELRAPLAEAVRRQRHIDGLLELGLERAARALEGRLPVALLKGSAAAALAYPSSAWRFRRDLDLLVGEGLPEARRLLLADGWRDDMNPAAGALDPRHTRAWSLVMPLGANRVALDLHRGLVEPAWCRPDPASMLARAIAGRARLPVTDAPDTFLHTVLHLVGNGFHEPLKGWMDLVRLLPLVPPDELARRAEPAALGTATWLCLDVLGRWFDLATGSHQLNVAPSRTRQALLRHLSAGDHATPERQPLSRGLARRLWRALASDRGAPPLRPSTRP